MGEPQAFLFEKLPPELQQHVFKHVSARPDNAAANVLRRWFEKKEVNAVIAADTTGDHLIPRYWDDPHINDDHSDDSDDNEDYNEDDHSDSANDDHSDGDEDGDADVVDGDDSDSDSDGSDLSDLDSVEDVEDITGENELAVSEAGMEDGADGAPIRLVRPHAKWRHISNFLRISECPPPVALLQTSKTMHAAAMAWFYEVTVMEIDATGSFAHTSMFETALEEITAAQYTPFKTIRKVKLLFVWDTDWLRSPACNGMSSFFEQILFIRVTKILEILDQDKSPCLSQICVEWHDSVQDDASTAFKDNICAFLATLPVSVTHKNKYLAPGAEPDANSPLGRKRLEFQAIADTGFNLM